MANGLMELLQVGDGPLFWVAVVLLAAGVALITGAGAWQMRRLFPRGKILDRQPSSRGDETADRKPQAVGSMYDSRDAIRVMAAGAEKSSGPWATTGQSINDLACRLQEAADRLEHMGREFGKGDINTAESLLKHPDEDVEYIFKASTL